VAGGGDKKNHDRFQPWVIVEIDCLDATSTRGVARYDHDDSQVDLSHIRHHAPRVMKGMVRVKKQLFESLFEADWPR
jgi:hypothetical protein